METTTFNRDCLVAVVTTDADLARFNDERWYRVPARSVGRSIGADALGELRHIALYQSGSIHNGLRSSIELHSSIDRIEIAPRRAIIPSEPEHPSADEHYHVIHVARVQRLAAPIVSRRPRRITFVRTTHERLLRASDINELFIGSRAEEVLWPPLRELGAERRCFMTVNDEVLDVDFAIVRGNRCVGVICNDDQRYEAKAAAGAWSVVRFSNAEVEGDLAGCLHEIAAALRV